MKKSDFSVSWELTGYMLVTPKSGKVFPNPHYDWWRVHKTRESALQSADTISKLTGKKIAIRKVLITL